MKFIIPIEPVACPRPRVSKHGVYYPSNYKTYLKNASLFIKPPKTPLESFCGFSGTFYLPTPKTPTHAAPVRPDIDNMVKAALDLLVMRGVLKDDGIVLEIKARKLYADFPQSEIEIYPVEVPDLKTFYWHGGKKHG